MVGLEGTRRRNNIKIEKGFKCFSVFKFTEGIDLQSSVPLRPVL